MAKESFELADDVREATGMAGIRSFEITSCSSALASCTTSRGESWGDVALGILDGTVGTQRERVGTFWTGRSISSDRPEGWWWFEASNSDATLEAIQEGDCGMKALPLAAGSSSL